jgi:hypothetical protein
MKPFLPVVGYLYRAVDKAVFLCPGTEDIAASLFMCCPGGIEITTVYGCNAINKSLIKSYVTLHN